MICPQRDSFQLFWQHLKKEDAMRSSLCVCLEIFSHTVLLHSHHGTFEFQSLLFPRKVSRVTFIKKQWKGIFFFIIQSIESQETLFVSANLE